MGWNETVAGGKVAMRFIYDALVGLDDANNLDADWGLAASWDMTPDGKQWTFNLKEAMDLVGLDDANNLDADELGQPPMASSGPSI